MYPLTHAHTHTCTYTYTQAHKFTCALPLTHAHTHTCTNTYTQAHQFTCALPLTHTHTHLQTYVYGAHTYACKHMFTFTLKILTCSPHTVARARSCKWTQHSHVHTRARIFVHLDTPTRAIQTLTHVQAQHTQQSQLNAEGDNMRYGVWCPAVENE